MKKIIPLIIIISLLLPTILALNLEIEKTSSNEIMVAGVDKPATFIFNIKNLGQHEDLEFYNLVSFRMFPVGTTPIEPLETKEVKLEVSPIGEFDHLGFYTFSYFIKGKGEDQIEKTLTFKRITLDETLEIGAGSFDPGSSSIEVFVRNKENFNFGEAKARLYSSFFDVEKTFTLGPNERKNITIELDKEDFKQLMAGFYTLNAEIKVDEAKTELQAPLKFLEKQIVSTSEENQGFIIATKVIKKSNDGNVIANAQVTSTKNIISRLFTSFSPLPGSVERKGFIVNYAWNKQLKPGEVFEVSVTTNYIFPLIIAILIVIIVALAKYYTSSNLVLKKNVAFVRAKGGEFALKVTIFAHARKYLENIFIIDKLPPLVKIYEQFGIEKPSKIDQKNNRIEWNFQKLEAGETRIMTYIIYSKVGVLGKFALPETRGIYEREGKIHETESNKTFFVAEPQKKIEED